LGNIVEDAIEQLWMIVDYSTIKVAGIYHQLPKSDIVPLIKEAQK
jgi:hypothetical protein